LDITFGVLEVKKIRSHIGVNYTLNNKFPVWDEIITSALLHVNAIMVTIMTVILPPPPPTTTTTTSYEGPRSSGT
jgi:hypothetical protein